MAYPLELIVAIFLVARKELHQSIATFLHHEIVESQTSLKEGSVHHGFLYLN